MFVRTAKRLWPDVDATGLDYFDFLNACGSPRLALFYSRLFWPEFVDFQDMTFLDGTVDDDSGRTRVLEALATYEGDRAETERSFNNVEIPSLFGRLSGESTDDEDTQLAEQICSMWGARLRQLFPDRAYVVEVQPATDEGDEIAVMFYRKR